VDHALRRTRVLDRLPDLGVDAFLVTRLPNVRYLTGFTGSAGQLLLGGAGSVFFTDGRYTEQSRHEVPDLERVTCLAGFTGPVNEACGSIGVGRLAFESAGLTYRVHADLAEALAGVELVAADDQVERLRWVKDAEELHHIENAQEATDQAFDAILDTLAVGMTERQVAGMLDDLMRRAADGLAFETIVAFGENAAEPHHEPTYRALEDGDVVKMDFGALSSGYHTDMTRTVSFGATAPELRKIYDLVREAQQAGVDAVRPGVSGRDVDAVSRAVIEDAGYGDRFTHGLGHGVGLEIHEGPRLARTVDDVIPEGAVVTVEPGIYVPGLGGVRIEDTVEVTADGCRVIASSTKEPIEL
jgi:Xaa-Pro aminopeptidase